MYVGLAYPPEDKGLIRGSRVYGERRTSADEAAADAARLMARAHEKRIGASLAPFAVEVDDDGWALDVTALDGEEIKMAAREENPKPAVADDSPSDDTAAARFAREVWKSKPDGLSKEEALVGLLRASGLDRKAAQAAVNAALPKEDVQRTSEEEKELAEKRLERNLKAQWSDLVEADPNLRQLTQGDGQAIRERVRETADAMTSTPETVQAGLATAAGQLLEAKDTVHDLARDYGTRPAFAAVEKLQAQDTSWEAQEMGRMLREIDKWCPACESGDGGGPPIPLADAADEPDRKAGRTTLAGEVDEEDVDEEKPAPKPKSSSTKRAAARGERKAERTSARAERKSTRAARTATSSKPKPKVEKKTVETAQAAAKTADVDVDAIVAEEFPGQPADRRGRIAAVVRKTMASKEGWNTPEGARRIARAAKARLPAG